MLNGYKAPIHYPGWGRQVLGSITSGAAALVLTRGALRPDQTGDAITVKGAGVAGADLVTTILSRADATHVTLAANAGTTVVAAEVIPTDEGAINYPGWGAWTDPTAPAYPGWGV